jgi:hypothetical protein
MQSPYLSNGAAPSFGTDAAAWGGAANLRNNSSSNLRALFQMLSDHSEKEKQTVALGKAAQAAYKSSPQLQEKIGMTPEGFQALSATDQHSAVTGAIAGDAYERGRTEEQLRTKQMLQQLASMESTQTANTAFGNDVSQVYGRNTMNTLAQGNGPVNPPPVDARQIAAGLSPQAWQSPQASGLLRELAQGSNQQSPFFQQGQVGQLLPVKGADGFGIAVTGPNQSQVLYTGGPQAGAVNVPGVGNVGVITSKPGNTTIVPGQTTEGQIRAQLAKAEADAVKLRTKLKADPELQQYLGGALAEQESLIQSYRGALGEAQATRAEQPRKSAVPQAGEVRGGYRFKGGNPNDKANWEAVQ